MINKKYLWCAVSFERFDNIVSACIVYKNGKINFEEWECKNQKDICEMYMYYANHGAYVDTFSIEDLGYEFHHSEHFSTYESRVNGNFVAEPYKGRFGEGIIIDMPDYNSEWFNKRMYFIKDGE